MARVRSFSQAAGNARLHPTEVDAEWSVVDSPNGRLLQISTFGSDTRKGSGVSQTLQLDEQRVRELRTVIEALFPDLS